MVGTYKDLKFWQTAKEVSILSARFIKKLPNERAVWIISDQLLRASFSVGANIAEGFGKYKGLEYSRFIRMALGSANETRYWLDLLSELYPNFSQTVGVILAKNMESIKMLTATLITLKKNRA